MRFDDDYLLALNKGSPEYQDAVEETRETLDHYTLEYLSLTYDNYIKDVKTEAACMSQIESIWSQLDRLAGAFRFYKEHD